ncbi:MAG: hypothetical protein B7X81_07425 [Hydrogenophilales bacterium 17-61-76]|nr:MAG: hypothetical protein B7X81_07425 [Hydrogenophilales bacterium 17-61-76]
MAAWQPVRLTATGRLGAGELKFGYGLPVKACLTARRLAKTVHALRIDFNIALLVLVGLVLFVLVALNSYQNLHVMEQTTNLRAQAREGVVSSVKVLSLLKDLETGQRGYILTGDPDYLGPYQAGLAQIGPAFSRLQQQLAYLPLTFEIQHSLNPLIKHRIKLARRSVETRRLKGFDAALKTIKGNEGRVTMDAIRVHFARLDRVLRQEIDSRNQTIATLKRRPDASAPRPCQPAHPGIEHARRNSLCQPRPAAGGVGLAHQGTRERRAGERDRSGARRWTLHQQHPGRAPGRCVVGAGRAGSAA